MAKNKYNYKITDIDALEAFAANAVQVTKKPIRSMITKLLDADIKGGIPGVEIVKESEEHSKKVI